MSRFMRRGASMSLSGAVVGALIATTFVVTPPTAEASTARHEAPAVKQETPVPGRVFTPRATPAADATAQAASKKLTPASWPKAARGSAALGSGTAPTRVAGTPVSVARAAGAGAATSGSVEVSVLDHGRAEKAGVNGLALTVTGDSASTSQGADRVRVSVDYAGFATAYGGDWASRLRLVDLRDCDLTSASAQCQGTALKTVNDTTAKTASADVSLSTMTTLALVAAPEGSAGSYSATSLSQSSTWQVNLQNGDFTWSYPLRVPPAVNGPAPSLSLDYSSGSVDGRTASTNNQAGWVGEGFTLEPGFIERKYVTCADDMTGGNNTTKTYDQCWKSDNATLSLAGHSSELVKTASGFTLKNADGSKIERLTGGTNSDNDTEYWKFTASDGTQYFFGAGKRYAADTINTNSTWTVPVFGNQSGEPCHQSTYAASYCTQAWRWNLDYVVDPDGNTMTYFYTPETNSYGRNNNTAVSSYVRGGYLARVEYGERKGSEATTTAPMQVVFTTAERCIPNSTFTCDPSLLTSTNASKWPDVPFDQICTSTTSCTNRVSPSFFSRKRLVTVTTQYLSGTAYKSVDKWVLDQSFPDPGDGTTAALWLAKVTHTGLDGTAIELPPVTFTGTQMANRVDGLDNAPPLIKWRIANVRTESGTSVNVNYTPAECVPGGTMPASPSNDTKRCFPVYWSAPGDLNPTLNYFHKYLVSSLVVDDLTTDAPDQATYYDYLGDPAWHYDDNELSQPKYRTYSDWRGYAKVNVRSGEPGKQTLDSYTFMRGMDGDPLPGGGKRSASVTDSEGVALTDDGRLSGFQREQITYAGVGGAEVTGTINDPWISGVIASDGTDEARFLKTAKVRTRTALAAGGYRRTQTSTTYESTYGTPTQVEDLGDVSTDADDLCTRLTYARNTTAWIVDRTSRSETVSVRCATTPSRPAQVVSDTRTFYDALAWGAAPTRGNQTRLEAISGWTTGPVYALRGRFDYDVHGRVTATYDASDKKTSTVEYTPATGGPVTAMKTTNALGFANTSTVNPAFGANVAEVDVNGRRTDLSFDSLGRLTGVWAPGRDKASGATATAQFSYALSKTSPTVVTSKELTNSGGYTTRYAIFDGLLRQRQTQTPAATGTGRLITDTMYDVRGNAFKQVGPSYDTAAPGGTLFAVNEQQAPAMSVTTYDGANRPVDAIFSSHNIEKWRTTTTYGGDRTSVTPPAGGTPTTTVTDAHGRPVQLLQYKGTTPSGPADTTTYAYEPGGKIDSVKDPAGNEWTYDYDLLGRATRTSDPDKGVTTTTYDSADRVATVKDARGKVLAFEYDLGDRKTAMYQDSLTGPKLASWLYDTLAGAKGKLTSATRYDNGNAYTNSVTGYDVAYRPTGNTVTIPTTEGALGGTYTTSLAYNLDGGIRSMTLPKLPGIVGETLDYTYDALGQPVRLAGYGAIVNGTTYSPYGEVTQYSMGNTPNLNTYETVEYEEGTRRLASVRVDRDGTTAPDSITSYVYDLAGNVTSIADDAGALGTDRQCFRYDYLRRLTQAWTPATDPCTTDPSVPALGGPAPYWQEYGYDVTGNRKSLTSRSSAGTTTQTLNYPAPGQPRPHFATGMTTDGPAGPTSGTYSPDEAGNTVQRPNGPGTQTLTWDAEGHVSSIVDSVKGTTSFLYDANGERLIRREPGATTLYLDNTEIRLDTATNLRATTRYYVFNAKTVAVRTSGGVQFLVGDHHGTESIQVDGETGDLTRRRMDPFGNVRGSSPAAWVGQRGFVGGTLDDSTGLTHLGAREYDPVIGRFISVDPMVDMGNPATLNAYHYANNSPATTSDPSGLMYPAEDGGGCGCASQAKSKASPPKAEPTPAQQEAQTRVNAATAKREQTKERIKAAAKEVVKIAADELGITDGLNCFVNGDLGACGATAVNILSSFAGGMAGKLLSKYGLPWKWEKGAELASRLWRLAGEAIDAVKGWFKAGDELVEAQKAMSAADAAADAARTSGELGRVGEAATTELTGLPKNTNRIPSASQTKDYRVPDHMDDAGRYIGETKNVSRLSLTSQLRDDASYVTRGGRPGRVDVFIDTRTVISRPLLRAHLDPGNPINLVTVNFNG